jgi:probable rRNA maturation factor
MKLDIMIEDEGWRALRGLRRRTQEAMTLAIGRRNVAVSVLFAGDGAIRKLNRSWRGKDKATNVLSFPARAGVPLPRGEPRPLGDIALAYGVVAREANQQGKRLSDHAMHMLVHGALHLLDYDHESEQEAQAMERREIRLLARLGIENPYRHEQ